MLRADGLSPVSNKDTVKGWGCGAGTAMRGLDQGRAYERLWVPSSAPHLKTTTKKQANKKGQCWKLNYAIPFPAGDFLNV